MHKHQQQDKQCHILYMGDHDPSGMDMVLDIRDRLKKFGCFVSVERIALNMDQIDEYDLPPNFIKKTDPHSSKYYDKYGNNSWELDALNPEDLTGILQKNILNYLDRDEHDEALKSEDKEICKLGDAIEGMYYF